jgi:putative transcriptional regulator
MKIPNRNRRKRNDGYLDGQLLIAMPLMSDKRFARSVIYMCAHSEEGAMGLIINQRASHINFPDLLDRLDIPKSNAENEVANEVLSMPVFVGGPVETGRGFVLHSPDYFATESSLLVGNSICLTATIDILKAIAVGEGPRNAIMALGYSGWSPGQLEGEIHANGWLHCPADADLVFASDIESKYPRALAKIGIDPSHLVSEAGHA